MNPVHLWWRGLILAAVLCLTDQILLFASDEQTLTKEQSKQWRVDFICAFRVNKELKDPNDLVRRDRQLLEKLKSLEVNAQPEKTKQYFAKYEVTAVMASRDKIVVQFQRVISGKGENEVPYQLYATIEEHCTAQQGEYF